MKIRMGVSMPKMAAGLFKRRLSVAFEAARRDAEPKIRALVVDRLSQAAERELRSDGAAAYKDAVKRPDAVRLDLTGVTVSLKSPFVEALENGMRAFDMKQRLLARAKKSSKKGVPYVDVPFKHPSSSVSKGDKRALAKASKTSGNATARIARRTPGRLFERTLIGGGLLGLRDKRQVVQHKRGLQDDLIRTSTKGGRGSYTTVRRISATSDASAWWHPGFRGAKLVPKVFRGIKSDVTSILRDSLRARGVRLR